MSRAHVRVLCTGGTGFIGRAMVRTFLARGWSVDALVRRSDAPAAQALVALGARLVSGDVRDESALAAAMSDADLVVNNAGMYKLSVSAGDARDMRAVNVDGARNVLELAVRRAVPRIVHVSSTLVYGATGARLVDEAHVRTSPPLSMYEATKLEAHAHAVALQRAGAPLVVVCPGGVIGPGDHSEMGTLARLYVRGALPPVLWGAHGARPSVHVDDCAEGIALAAERGRVGEVYNLAGGVMEYDAMFALWSTTAGGMRPRAYMPRPLAAVVGAIAGPLLRAVGWPAIASSEVVATSFIQHRVSSAKAERELGWHPRPVERAWLETLAAERDLIAREKHSSSTRG